MRLVEKHTIKKRLALLLVLAVAASAQAVFATTWTNHHSDHGEALVCMDGLLVSGSKPRNQSPTIKITKFPENRVIHKSRDHYSLASRILPWVTLGFVRDIHASIDSSGYITAGTDRTVKAHKHPENTLAWSHSHHDDAVWEVSAGATIVASAGRDSRVVSVDRDTGDYIWSHTHHRRTGDPSKEMTRTVYIDEPAELVYSAGFDGIIIAASVEDGSVTWTYNHGETIKSVKSNENKVFFGVFSVDDPYDVYALDPGTNEIVWSHRFHNHAAAGYRGKHAGVEDLALHDSYVISAGDDGSVVGVARDTGDLAFRHTRHNSSVRAVTSCGDYVASIDRDGTVVFYKP